MLDGNPVVGRLECVLKVKTGIVSSSNRMGTVCVVVLGDSDSIVKGLSASALATASIAGVSERATFLKGTCIEPDVPSCLRVRLGV